MKKYSSTRALIMGIVAAAAVPAIAQEGTVVGVPEFLNEVYIYRSGAWNFATKFPGEYLLTLAVDHDNRFYYFQGGDGKLHRVPPSPPLAIAPLPRSYGELTFAPCTGKLYGMVATPGEIHIYEIDPPTGAEQLLLSRSLPAGTIADGLAFNPADARFYFLALGPRPGEGDDGVYWVDVFQGGPIQALMPRPRAGALFTPSRLVVWGDDLTLVAPFQFSRSYVASIENPGLGWTAFDSSPAAIPGMAVDVAGWLAPAIPTAPCPTRCTPDCDTSTGRGVLDIFDFLCFQNAFAASAPYACECDTSSGMGVCDIFDFLCFQNAFAAGCP